MAETIAAIATPYGEGGIGVVKISGENSLQILYKVFKSGTLSSAAVKDRHLYYGKVEDPKNLEVIDECLAVFMEGPKSYTGEDVVEIHCHGSIVSLRRILMLVLSEGARIAEEGEFTKRAFLNGRLDLSEAEAVIDLIKAKTDKAYDAALLQMEGGLSLKIKYIRQNLLDLLVDITVNLDYPDEDIEELTYENLLKRSKSINEEIIEVLSTSNTGKIISEGINIAIIGKPNVGKSSLMNALLKEARAIVTEIPGTTRDTIEESLSIDGIPVKLTDTAGIRETDDIIEKIGIEKSKESFNMADLIIFILESHKDLEDEDKEIIEKLKNKKVIVLFNKIDLGKKLSKTKIKEFLPEALILETSILQSKGLKDLEEAIIQLVWGGHVKQEKSLVITNVRHERLLKDAAEAISDAISMGEAREALDFIEIDLKKAWESLGEIIGESVSEDIIDEVFSRFCLGK